MKKIVLVVRQFHLNYRAEGSDQIARVGLDHEPDLLPG